MSASSLIQTELSRPLRDTGYRIICYNWVLGEKDRWLETSFLKSSIAKKGCINLPTSQTVY